MTLRDQVVVVVGCGSTIGQAISTAFFEENAQLSLIDTRQGEHDVSNLNQHHLLKMKKHTWDEPMQLMKEVQERNGKITTLVIIPEVNLPKAFMNVTEDDWDGSMDAVVQLGLRFMQEMVHHQKEGEEQRIILVLPSNTTMPFQGSSAQSAACAAMETIAQVAAVDLGPRNIKVNSIIHGWISSNHLAMYEVPPELAEQVTPGIPLNRCANSREIAEVVMFLSSPSASYITGASLKVDGGYTVTKGSGQVFPTM